MPLSPLWLEDMLVLADMLPTLLESSMLPRERLRLRLMPRLTQLSSTLPMDTLDTLTTMDMLDTPTAPPTHTPMDTPMPMAAMLMLLPQLSPPLLRLPQLSPPLLLPQLLLLSTLLQLLLPQLP